MKKRFQNVFSLILLAVTAVAMLIPAAARPGVSMILRFDELDAAGPNDGDWYKDSTNESGTLAWGESYVMMAYVQMVEATGERKYLDKIAEHADGVLGSRDDVRGAADYTGTANPCWQAASYSAQPMCWAVHSGMLTFPMAMFAAFVAADERLATQATYDGSTYAEKAEALVTAVLETYDFHESEWRNEGASSGYYIFPADASFYAYAGQEMPLNQMNAMGRTAAALWAATGEAAYLDRAARLAGHLAANLTAGSGDTYMWNYWGGAYASPGEDISHAAISVGFAALCAQLGIVFDADDMFRFGRTFFNNVIIDNHSSHDNVGGGGINGDSYRPQMGRWAVLGEWDPRVVAPVRNFYTSTYTGGVSSGSVLLGFALLARYEYYIRPFTFYVADWNDLGDRRQATANNANVSTLPHDPAVPVFFQMTFQAFRELTVQQWNDVVYTDVLNLAGTGGGTETVVAAFDPRWYFPYTPDGALFQFNDDFVAGQGIIIYSSETCDPPEIGTDPPGAELDEGAHFELIPAAAGHEPMLWFLDGPAGATVDRETGRVLWTAAFSGAEGEPFILKVENDCGFDELFWTVDPIPAGEDDEPAAEPADTPDAATDTPVDTPAEGLDMPADLPVDPAADDAAADPATDIPIDTGPPTDDDGGGCGCSLAA
ncbi:MAG: hypothetical protein ABIJ56_22255 [Pseudomonadota bacterium]